MDKTSLVELQKIDCNCNDCIFMARNTERFASFNHLYVDNKKASYRLNYGNCTKLNKPVSFIPGNCQLHTQDCFKHRRDGTT